MCLFHSETGKYLGSWWLKEQGFSDKIRPDFWLSIGSFEKAGKNKNVPAINVHFMYVNVH
jgi:hypothetical protein